MQVLRRHIKGVVLTPGNVEGERVFNVDVEFKLDSTGDSDVLLTGSMDASMQQYGFNTITVTGLVLDTRVVRKRRIPVSNESAVNASAVTASVSV